MNFLGRIREKARSLTLDNPLRSALFAIADDLHEAIMDFNLNRDYQQLKVVNGLWAKADSLMAQTDNVPDSPSGGSLQEGARLAA